MAENHPPNWNSRNLTHGWQRGVNVFFWGLGFKPEDFNKAQIGCPICQRQHPAGKHRQRCLVVLTQYHGRWS
ncbi:MAG TPA: hypothetical protein PLB55_16775 [Prosthecobacter sp.]|nr:hypothetical protein [Prosthecobacter sp.]